MTLISKEDMEPINNLRGGKGTVYCSKDYPIGDRIGSQMILGPGDSIGLHRHDDNEEVYVVIAGGPATINGEARMMAICRVGKSHDCVNNTDEDLTLLSIKN